ncbi:hypothetical protein GCM10011487_28620 [Steroidobacter agaridevorans]|uniref:Uncharacterized protein n=1 Tax=Steroidobacter agaridevorans TaxID=2695856 RepID=A0A829YDV4_9GAMM|nr:hypothetical protein [Steroidobacter agaridevorans]GFE80862.1 hypothetical protein GCM10011487_28620 [Steroidobacter agaridevorans]
MSPRQLFGGILSIVLLGLFVFLLWKGFAVLDAVVACNGDDCILKARAQFNENMKMALNTIAGLIAAIVVAELAITRPTEVPSFQIFAVDNPTPAPPSTVAKIAALLYLAAWVITGLAAYIKGSLHHPDAFEPITSYGNAWFGLAVGAVYAYFGLKRP